MKHTDDIAAGIGGVILTVIGQVTFASIFETIVFAFLGGFIGVLAKKLGEWVWHKYVKKDKK